MKKGLKTILAGLLLAGMLLSVENVSMQVYAAQAAETEGSLLSTEATLAKPKLVSATNSKMGVKVTWEKVSGATGYELYRRVSGGSWSKVKTITGGTTVSITDSSAVSGTKYYYTVKAVKGSTVSGYDAAGVSVWYVATPKLVSAANAVTGVKVTWESVQGAKGYNIYRKTEGASWTKIKSINSSNAVTYTDTNAKSGTVYYYMVRASREDGLSGYDGTGVSTLFLSVPKLKSVSGTDAGVRISWNAVTGADGYYVYRKVSGGSWARIKTVSGSTKLSTTDTIAVSGTTYYYTVKAYSNKTSGMYDTTGLRITYSKAPAISAERKLMVDGKTYYIGQNASELGTPAATLTSAYGFTWNVYGITNYRNFFAAGVANGKVVALASSGVGFTYQGMRCGSQKGSFTTSECNVTIATDKNDNYIVHGVFITTKDYNEYQLWSKPFTSTMLANESKMNFYFTNAFRVYHGLTPLVWDARAARAGQLHSQDMADQNYFAHDSLDGRTAWERMEAQGINWRAAAENIDAGYFTGFDSYSGWVNSSGHRANMLKTNVTHLGVGGGYNPNSSYNVYYTQDYFAEF